MGRTGVLEVLRALPGVGPAKARQILAEARVPEGKRLRGLGRLQRLALLDAVARRGL